MWVFSKSTKTLAHEDQVIATADAACDLADGYYTIGEPGNPLGPFALALAPSPDNTVQQPSFIQEPDAGASSAAIQLPREIRERVSLYDRNLRVMA